MSVALVTSVYCRVIYNRTGSGGEAMIITAANQKYKPKDLFNCQNIGIDWRVFGILTSWALKRSIIKAISGRK